MLDKEGRRWIRMIWAHHRLARRSGYYRPTRFWSCVRATIAITLNLQFEGESTLDLYEVAWDKTGSYHTDYGDGESFEVCGVSGFRYAIWSDGTL